MGKVAPVIPAALQRQLDVRKALAPSGRRQKWMRGYRGSQKAAERLLERQAPKASKTRVTWNDVPHHVQEGIMWQISLRDLENVRLAGFGGRDPEWRSRLRAIFLARVKVLTDVQSGYVLPVNAMRRFGQVTRADRYAAQTHHTPTTFSEMRRLFFFAGGNRESPVPIAIGEMRAMTRLIVLGDVIKRLPASLVYCESLRELHMKGQGFECVPSVVLRLRKLRQLVLRDSSFLTTVQENVGVELVELGKLDIQNCPKVRELPESLIKRLESSTFKLPLELTPSNFSEGYLAALIDPVKFPRIRGKCRAAYPDYFPEPVSDLGASTGEASGGAAERSAGGQQG